MTSDERPAGRTMSQPYMLASMTDAESISILLKRIIDALIERGRFEAWEYYSSDDQDLPFIRQRLARALALSEWLTQADADQLAILLQNLIDTLIDTGYFFIWQKDFPDDDELPWIYDKLTRALALAKKISSSCRPGLEAPASHRLQ